MHKIEKFVSPWQDKRFYENAFPHLFPFGRGGLGRIDSPLKLADFVELLVSRGGDQRFSKDKLWMFSVFTEIVRTKGSSVAFQASLMAGIGGASTMPVLIFFFLFGCLNGSERRSYYLL